jgi:hypothetical protein
MLNVLGHGYPTVAPGLRNPWDPRLHESCPLLDVLLRGLNVVLLHALRCADKAKRLG